MDHPETVPIDDYEAVWPSDPAFPLETNEERVPSRGPHTVIWDRRLIDAEADRARARESGKGEGK